MPLYEEIFLSDSSLAKTFWGRTRLEYIYAYLKLEQQNISRKVLHQLKYKKNVEVGNLVAQQFGRCLMSNDRFILDMPHFLVPVPLHPRKLLQRGYNQSEIIAEGISEKTGIPVLTDLLLRVQYNKSQTTMNRHERWDSSKDLFELNDRYDLEALEHIGIVDDVITTGATIEAIANTIHQKYPIRLSVLSLAFTS
ncbi:ComF family protein [bacterium]|nr:ComF family protein [bacterium]